MKNIGVLVEKDSTNPRNWSGIPFFITRELSAQSPITLFNAENRLLLKSLKAKAKVIKWLSGRRSLPSHSRTLATAFAQSIRMQIEASEVDILVAIACSTTLGKLTTNKNIIYTSDATVRLMIDYYPRFTKLSPSAKRTAEWLEARAIQRADLIVYPTHWAANSAIRDYGASPEKVRVIPYGANLLDPPKNLESRDSHDPVCKLLFVGVDWNTKGGQVALNAFRQLRRKGVNCQLTICGCVPPITHVDEGVRVIPFLDKNVSEDRESLANLYRNADFFILPSRCECFGIVFCEAAAFGLPSIAAATGGIPEVVVDGENGFTLPVDDDGSGYAETIAHLWTNRNLYESLRHSSRKAYESRLNWNHWGNEFWKCLRSL